MSILGTLFILALILGIALAAQIGYTSAKAVQKRILARLNSERSREMRLAFEGLPASLASRTPAECGAPCDK